MILFKHNLAQANSLSCYSFIPYGYLEFYNKLIQDTDDCYFYFKKVVQFKTGDQGERIIRQVGATNFVLGIGESQLLGLDWSDDGSSGPHDLNTLFPGSQLKLYAAPNNGPIQNMYRLKEIPDEVLMNAEAVVIGFNYSTDIFRIINNWDHKTSSPIAYSYFSTPFFKYVLFDLALMNARLSGKKFGDAVANRLQILEEYRGIKKDHLLKIYIDTLGNMISDIHQKNRNVTLIIYPPYWGIGADGELEPDISNDYKRLVCTSIKYLPTISNIFFVTNETFTLSEDRRHFPQGSLKYDTIAKCDDAQTP